MGIEDIFSRPYFQFSMLQKVYFSSPEIYFPQPANSNAIYMSHIQISRFVDK